MKKTLLLALVAIFIVAIAITSLTLGPKESSTNESFVIETESGDFEISANSITKREDNKVIKRYLPHGSEFEFSTLDNNFLLFSNKDNSGLFMISKHNLALKEIPEAKKFLSADETSFMPIVELKNGETAIVSWERY